MNYEVKEVPFSIEVVNTGNKYNALETWVASRDTFLEIDYPKHIVRNKENGQEWDLDQYNDDLLKMDIAMCYFNNVTIKIKSSILLREFFFQFGDHARWAKSSRYDNPDEFSYSSDAVDFLDMTVYSKYIQAIQDYNDTGKVKPFDKVRELMPLAWQTTYFLNLPIKQFMKYLAGLKLICDKFEFPNLWKVVYTECWKQDVLKPYMTHISKYENCEEIRTLLNPEMIGSKPGAKRFRVGEVLYSQLIRHEGVKTNGFYYMLKEMQEGKDPNCKIDFDCDIEVDQLTWDDILKVRTSFFVVNTTPEDPNSWLTIIDKEIVRQDNGLVDLRDNFKLFKWFIKNDSGEYVLNKSVVDRYMLDDSNRLKKGYNAYFPDAFGLEWEAICRCRIDRDGNSSLNQLYLQHFTLGFIKDNPNNKYRKLWLELNPDRDFDELAKTKFYVSK